MITKKTILALTIAACGMAGIAAGGSADAATFCFPASTGGTTRLPFGNATAQIWGCSVNNVGGICSGTGSSQNVSGTKQVCANLTTGAEVETRGLDSLGNSIAGCRATDNSANGVQVCDVTGCASGQAMDIVVESL
jgi:hypothetical protein